MSLLRLVSIACGMACLLPAQDEGRQKVQVSNTQRLDFPAGGALRVTGSSGEVMVEGWDQPNMEITVVKSTQDFYNQRDREKVSQELDRLRVTAERQGEAVVVSTTAPRRRSSPMISEFHIAAHVDLEYRIRVPRDARLIIVHRTGEVHVTNVLGDIQVKVLRGGITVGLPGDGQYGIGAKSDLGSVHSDFSGQTKRKRMVGQTFAEDGAPAAHKVNLRVGYGDILLQKPTKLPAAR